jgi:branched-chain amino acid transport system ATP-binding protein
MRREVRIAAVGLSFSVNGRAILAGLNFEAEAGRVYGIFGPNGGGKTTLFNVLSGLYRPTAGRVLLYGSEPRRHDPYHVSAHKGGLARTFQVPAVSDHLSVEENLLLSYRLPGEGFASLFYRSRSSLRREAEARREITEHLEVFGLSHKAETPAGALSYGERRLLTNIGALLTSTGIVLLDEPFANVNVRHVAVFKRLLRGAAAAGRVVLLIEHLPDNLLGLADTLLQLRGGREVVPFEVGESSPEELVRIVRGSVFQYE